MFLNGICVWHPALLGKSPFWMTYYDVRNRLITMFSKKLSRDDFNEYLNLLSKKFILKIIRYEYDDAELTLDAIRDFLKGPEVFAATDALALHTELLKQRDILLSPEDIGISRTDVIEKKYPNFKIAVIIQVLCNMLPAKNKIYAVNTKFFNIPYNAKQIYLYHEKLGKGTVSERNQKKFFTLLWAFLKVRKELKTRYKKMLYDWQKAKPIFTSIHFWENYLGLKTD